jgi:predicted transcriptional regulator
MMPAKEEVQRILDQLPNTATLEDIQYHIYIRQKIEHGLEDVAAGRVFSAEEFDERMAGWLES